MGEILLLRAALDAPHTSSWLSGSRSCCEFPKFVIVWGDVIELYVMRI